MISETYFENAVISVRHTERETEETHTHTHTQPVEDAKHWHRGFQIDLLSVCMVV